MNLPNLDRFDAAGLPPALRFLDGGGEATRLILARDWSDHPIGEPEKWPNALKVSLSLVLNSPESMILAWGREELTFFFNTTYIPLLGPRVDWAMGASFTKVWADGWDQAKPIIDDAFAGRAERFVDLPWTLDTDRGARETWWSFSYSRVLDPEGEPAGLFIFTNETTARVQADAATREAQERLRRETERQRLSLQQTPGFASVLAGPHHVFEYVNEAYIAIAGRRDFIGRSMREVFPELEGQGFYELLDQVYTTGEPFRARALPVSLADEAQPRFVDLLYQPIRSDDGQIAGIFVGGYDVTELVRSQQRAQLLLTLDQRLADLADTAELSFVASELLGETLGATRVAYGVLDGDARTITIEKNWSRPGFADVAGLHHFSDYGSHIENLLRGEAVANVDVMEDPRSAANAASFKALGIASHLDVPVTENGRAVADMLVHADRPRIWTEEEIALVRDVAERTRAAIARRVAEKELRANEARLRLLNADLERQVTERALARGTTWQVSPEILGVINDLGCFEQSNPAWQSVLGWSEAEVAARVFFDFIHPDDLGRTQQAWVDAIERGQPALRFENRYRTKAGEWRWLSWVAVPEGGKVYCSARDITEDKEREAELEAAQEQLRQSQKMEAVGQLTGGLAHDFNNLLAGISGSLELISMRLAQGRPADVDKYVSAAQSAASRAAALTHRLLAFSRRQTLAPKAIDVKRLVADMADLIRRTVGPQVTLETVNSIGLWPSLIDPSQLENAVLNLCINARDAMPDGGTITIETANRWLNSRIAREKGLEPGQFISLSVSDTGIGMTPDVIAKAFDPFFTTKPIGMGTGLGLSMIYGFAKQSGGAVSIRSEPEQGTKVSIYLPRHLGEADEADSAQDLAAAPRGQGETVLIVDDEPTVRMLVREVLADLGYTAIEAEDGAAGLRIFNSKARVDLLITDVGLPGGMNGRQLADAARAIRPELKVLFITGYAENAVLSQGHLDSGMYVMTKPFAMEALASRIRELIAA